MLKDPPLLPKRVYAGYKSFGEKSRNLFVVSSSSSPSSTGEDAAGGVAMDIHTSDPEYSPGPIRGLDGAGDVEPGGSKAGPSSHASRPLGESDWAAEKEDEISRKQRSKRKKDKKVSSPEPKARVLNQKRSKLTLNQKAKGKEKAGAEEAEFVPDIPNTETAVALREGGPVEESDSEADASGSDVSMADDPPDEIPGVAALAEAAPRSPELAGPAAAPQPPPKEAPQPVKTSAAAATTITADIPARARKKAKKAKPVVRYSGQCALTMAY